LDKDFIDSVHKIVINHITDEKFGVANIASLLGLSTSQILRKVKAKTGKTVNQYIRELRLTKASKLIKETDLTIAEIAYKVGFGSASYFNKVFRKYYGITPGEYKTQKEEDPENKIDIVPKQKKPKFQKKIVFSILIIAILIISYVVIDKLLYQKINDQPPSIAVLPFKNISNETENQYLADGMWDDLLNHLSSIKGLDVRSRQSLEKYRESSKSSIEIGEELSAAYILESSVQKFENKLRIITQLIDAKSDKHIWSHEYDYELKDIFKIQCEMAKLITQKLNVILTDKEENILEKYPTENMAAYQLVLKGRSFSDIQTQKNLETSIEYFKQAIVLDPNYARAYAEIAQSYFILKNRGHHHKSSIDSAKIYVEKALNKDPNTFRAYAVRARINDYYSEWDKCKENYEKAIELNPNDAQVHSQYAIYFGEFKDFYNASIQRAIAQRLDPLNIRIGTRFFIELIKMGEIEKAEKYFEKWSFIYTKEDQIMKKCLLKVFKNKDWTEFVRILEEEIIKDPNNAFLNRYLGEAYDEILNDDSNCLKYAKKAYKLDSANSKNTSVYYLSLLENKKFSEAKRLLQSKNFKSLLNDQNQIIYTWYYYYHQENYDKAKEILQDSLIETHYYYKGLTYAQLGNRKKVDSFFSMERAWFPNSYKAFVYAALNEKDSMYYYLEKMDNLYRIRAPNGRREFDPYRKEERFKAFLRKNYFPLTHWNE